MKLRIILFVICSVILSFSKNIKTIDDSLYSPKWLVWSYDYKDVQGNNLDTNNVDFYVYYSNEFIGNYDLLGSESDTMYYFPQHINLYDGTTMWNFYVKAHTKSNNLYSLSSETVASEFNVDPSYIEIKKIILNNIGKNYPNPFNSTTHINITVIMKCNLVIYNINGKLIKRIPLTIGNNSLDISLTNEPSGMYFYGIEGIKAFLKMVYIK